MKTKSILYFYLFKWLLISFARISRASTRENLSSDLVSLKADCSAIQSGKPGTIRESNKALGVRKAHYALYYVRKSSSLLAEPGVRKISSVACGFSPIEFHFSDHLNILIIGINEVYVFFNKISL